MITGLRGLRYRRRKVGMSMSSTQSICDRSMLIAAGFEPDGVGLCRGKGPCNTAGNASGIVSRHVHEADEHPNPAASYHLNQGNVLREALQLEAAVAAYRQAIQIDPPCAEAHIVLGPVLGALERIEEGL